MDLPRLDNSNLWDKTYNILKERIVQREFGPNQKLSIPQLAEQFGISRTPIRDALNRLEMDGLVKTVSKVGTFVCAVSKPEVLEIMDTRLMLEFWVVEKLEHLPKEEIEAALNEMEKILKYSSDKLDTTDFKSYTHTDYNFNFHLAFIKLGKNQKNLDIYQNVMNYRFLAAKNSLISNEMILTALDQHLKIIESIRSGDINDIKNVLKLHLDDSKERLLINIERNGGTI